MQNEVFGIDIWSSPESVIYFVAGLGKGCTAAKDFREKLENF
jgi:hypothetical protein